MKRAGARQQLLGPGGRHLKLQWSDEKLPLFWRYLLRKTSHVAAKF
ncbi:MAG TPA: hypothetical protein VEP30_07090 [Chthoniobacterales bacterium]|nr:hypothetical protein [Chthoniobacterales bacterium]